MTPLFLIAGPCVIESRDMILRHAERLKVIADDFGVTLFFKSSYDKANRTSLSSFRGLGMERGLGILAEVREQFGLPLVTDVHEPHQCVIVAEVADVLQIPAFLCRQTDLLVEAGLTRKIVNIKKGQFLAPHDMQYAAEKVRATGNHQIWLTERGTTFGYQNLVVDMRALPIMKQLGYPVLFDATHSVQLPGAGTGITGGLREYIPHLAQAAVAAGVDGIFMEVHENPEHAKSDAATQFPLDLLPSFLAKLMRIHAIAQE